MLWLLLACTSGDDTATTGTRTPDALTVADVSVGDCGGDSAAVENLTATGGTGQVGVAHLGYRAECCLSFEVSASKDSATSTLLVAYTPTGTPCDCMCAYDIGYTLQGVPAGDWTLNAEGTTTTVHVD